MSKTEARLYVYLHTMCAALTCTVTAGSWCPEFPLAATHFISNFQLSRTTDPSCLSSVSLLTHLDRSVEPRIPSHRRLIVNQSPLAVRDALSAVRWTDGQLIERRKERNTVKVIVMVKARGHLRCRESGRAYSPFRIKLYGYRASVWCLNPPPPLTEIYIYLCNAEVKTSLCLIMRRYSSIHS